MSLLKYLSARRLHKLAASKRFMDGFVKSCLLKTVGLMTMEGIDRLGTGHRSDLENLKKFSAEMAEKLKD